MCCCHARCQEAIKENSWRASTLLLVDSLVSLWQMHQTQEANKSHWEIMVEFKSMHSKSQVSYIGKMALVNWDRIPATGRSVLVSLSCQDRWLPRPGGAGFLEKQRVKGRGEENWNKETLIKMANFLSNLYLKLESILPPFFLEYNVK